MPIDSVMGDESATDPVVDGVVCDPGEVGVGLGAVPTGAATGAGTDTGGVGPAGGGDVDDEPEIVAVAAAFGFI
jgi:hypothetical protein